jgi:hypothetical protein
MYGGGCNDPALCAGASREETRNRAGKGDLDAGADQHDAASCAARAEAAELEGIVVVAYP